MRSYIPIILILFIFSPSILGIVGGRNLPVLWYDFALVLSRLVITLWMLWIFNLDRLLNSSKINAIAIVLLFVYFGITVSKVLFAYTDYNLPHFFGRIDFFTALEIVMGFACLAFLYFPAKRILPERSAWFIVFELFILPFAVYNWTQHILIERIDQQVEEEDQELLDK